jgi:hypothetical protein
LDSIRGGGFLDWLRDYQLPKKNSGVIGWEVELLQYHIH